MHITNLRKVGGSIMLTVPPAILDLLHLEVGSTVGLAIEGDHLIVDPIVKPHYTMEELLAASDYSQSLSPDEQTWGNSPAAGRELV